MKTTSQQLFVGTLVLIGLFVFGCSRTPSEQIVRDVLERKIQDESGGNLRLGMFEKTNGIPQGESAYTLEFRARFSLTPGGVSHAYWAVSPGGMGPLEFKLYKNAPMTWHHKIAGMVEIEGVAELQKTENGWRVVGLSASKVADV